MNELRPYQAEALTAIRQTIGQGVRRLIVQGPCGFGKTRIASEIVQGALKKGNRLAFVVPAIALIDQAVEMFAADGITGVGIIQSNHQATDWSQPIQVCSIQTLQRRPRFPEAQVVVFDEVHRWFKTHERWITDPEWKNVPFIGLSATPWRKGLGKYFESLLIAATTQELIDQGYLSKFKVFATGHPDLAGVKVVAGDYHEGQLSGAMQKGTLTADIIQTWIERWNKDKTLCFGVDCLHAKALQERFIEAGISCAYQDANTEASERAEIKRGFHDGTYQVVSNVATLTTGIDWDVRCLVLARPTRSEMLFVQTIGRSLRKAEGKDYALILDHSDTTRNLGFVTDIHHESLSTGDDKSKDAKPPEPKPPLPKECHSCGMLRPPRTPICPNCGTEAKAVNKRHEVDGELFEILPGVVKQKTKTPKREYTMAEKAQFLAELKAYALQHNYKSGWASNKYKEKFQCWPDWSIKDIAPAAYPSAAIVSWCRSRAIAWANSKRRAETMVAT